MIFLTLGTQLPFDRLVKAMDLWAGAHPDIRVLGQINQPESYAPQHMDHVATLPPDEFDKSFDEARVIVSHAGMGSIITALRTGKPLLIMPRRAHLGEHRNDHQHATAVHFQHKPGLSVAWEEADLAPALEALLSGDAGGSEKLGAFAEDRLIEFLRTEIGV